MTCDMGGEGRVNGFVVVKEKLRLGNLAFSLLPNKIEWALVYSPEALCLHSADSFTRCSNELDL